jgi:hypothetical protein
MENVVYQTRMFEVKDVNTGITVYSSKDYEKFKIIEGNRIANPKHVNRLYQSIMDNGLLCNPIIVNKKYEIIDGQHRFLAAKKADIKIFYIMLDDYNLSDVHTLNLNQKNWTKKDFMDGFADMGLESYIKLKAFCEKNSDFTFTDCIALCSNKSTANSSSISHKNRLDNKAYNMSEVFEEGTWIGKDFDLAQKWAENIRETKKHFSGYNKSVFVGTMIIMLQNDSFEITEFLNKLSIQPKVLYDCANREQCKLMIENIYNYRRREKISLRY